MFKDERIWRFLCAIWTIVFMVFILIDFFSFHRYENLTAPFAAVYGGILTLYVGTKEFDRWYDFHSASHPGEFFIVGWTALMFILFGFTMFSNPAYVIPPEVVASYILVLSVFALTQKSKQLHRRRTENKKSQRNVKKS